MSPDLTSKLSESSSQVVVLVSHDTDIDVWEAKLRNIAAGVTKVEKLMSPPPLEESQLNGIWLGLSFDSDSHVTYFMQKMNSTLIGALQMKLKPSMSEPEIVIEQASSSLNESPKLQEARDPVSPKRRHGNGNQLRRHLFKRSGNRDFKRPDELLRLICAHCKYLITCTIDATPESKMNPEQLHELGLLRAQLTHLNSLRTGNSNNPLSLIDHGTLTRSFGAHIATIHRARGEQVAWQLANLHDPTSTPYSTINTHSAHATSARSSFSTVNRTTTPDDVITGRPRSKSSASRPSVFSAFSSSPGTPTPSPTYENHNNTGSIQSARSISGHERQLSDKEEISKNHSTASSKIHSHSTASIPKTLKLDMLRSDSEPVVQVSPREKSPPHIRMERTSPKRPTVHRDASTKVPTPEETGISQHDSIYQTRSKKDQQMASSFASTADQATPSGHFVPDFHHFHFDNSLMADLEDEDVVVPHEVLEDENWFVEDTADDDENGGDNEDDSAPLIQPQLGSHGTAPSEAKLEPFVSQTPLKPRAIPLIQSIRSESSTNAIKGRTERTGGKTRNEEQEDETVSSIIGDGTKTVKLPNSVVIPLLPVPEQVSIHLLQDFAKPSVLMEYILGLALHLYRSVLDNAVMLRTALLKVDMHAKHEFGWQHFACWELKHEESEFVEIRRTFSLREYSWGVFWMLFTRFVEALAANPNLERSNSLVDLHRAETSISRSSSSASASSDVSADSMASHLTGTASTSSALAVNEPQVAMTVSASSSSSDPTIPTPLQPPPSPHPTTTDLANLEMLWVENVELLRELAKCRDLEHEQGWHFGVDFEIPIDAPEADLTNSIHAMLCANHPELRQLKSSPRPKGAATSFRDQIEHNAQLEKTALSIVDSQICQDIVVMNRRLQLLRRRIRSLGSALGLKPSQSTLSFSDALTGAMFVLHDNGTACTIV